jgi:PleD family two-component response regulator
LPTDGAMTSCGLTERDETAHAPTHVTTQPNGRPRVMVVDDDLSMRNFLQSFLSARGYCAVALAVAEEAVKNDLSERPAAVISTW